MRHCLSIFAKRRFQLFQHRFVGEYGKPEYHRPPEPHLFGGEEVPDPQQGDGLFELSLPLERMS
jgi:hypothetical protein